MSVTSQEFESYVPVYDAVPEKWEDARPFLVETLKKISNAVNIREIGWFLDEELLSGKAFIPIIDPTTGTAPQFRQVLRKVIDTGALIVGAQSIAHGITFDSNFTLVNMWVAATNSTTLVASTIVNTSNLTMDATFINITSTVAYDRSYCVIEYLQEI